MKIPQITFSNTAPQTDWMSDGEKEFRTRAPEYITAIVAKESLFLEEEITVNFFQTGVASVVALLEQNRKRFVIKTCFKQERASVEAAVFLHWNKAGIQTPTVLCTGAIEGYSYFVMEYQDSPTISELIEKEPAQKLHLYAEMGHLFHKIHSIPIQDFGPLEIHDGLISGKYSSLGETLNIEITPNIQEALDILDAAKQKAMVGHFDFNPSHLFATDPLTIFDPDPEATLPCIDLAFFLLPIITEDEATSEMRKTVIATYMQDAGRIDPKLLAAGLVIKVNEKAHTLRLRPNAAREERAQYILDTAGSVSDALAYLQKYLPY